MIVNLNAFGPENTEKIEIMCEKVIELEINMILLSTPNRRWNIPRIEKNT